MADPEMKLTNSNDVNVDNYRKLVQTYISLHAYQTALFWGDKVVTLTCSNPRDVYWLAQCMYLLKQYHRAAHLLRSRNLDKMYVLCNNLTVRCLLKANELNEALKVINSMDMEVFLQNTTSQSSSAIESGMFDDTPRHQVQSSVLLLKGKVLEAMDNRGLASDCYRQALQCDVHCFEAFESLIQHHMLTSDEENDLVNSLPISNQCTHDEAEILSILYQSKLKKYHMPSQVAPTGQALNFEPGTPSYNLVVTKYDSTPLSSCGDSHAVKEDKAERKKNNDEVMNVEESNTLLARLHESLDLVVAQAEKLYYNCDYQRCNVMTEKILKQDPYHSACLPIHISCLVELKQSNKLFTLAHNLVDLYPSLAISWYAVGCYYYIIGKSDSARRYLAKATSLDRLFGPAWLAYGHSFAIENEHDQAMAAYFKASQLMKGCHLPLLYIGLECGLTNNVGLATKFFQQAIKIAPNDPFVLHEMGIITFQTLNYSAAEKCYRDALRIVRKSNGILLPERWAPLLNNLGHTLRRQRKYEEALECHHEALVLCPQVASTYSAIAYVHSLTGNLIEAVDWFHRALGLKRDDTFSTTMLNYVLEHLSEDETPYPGAPDHIPDFYVEPKPDRNSVQDILDESESPVTTAPNLEALDMNMCIEVDMPDISGIIKE